MPLPTLLEPGKLKRPAGVPPETAPLDYILDWVRRRLPQNGAQGGALADRILVVKARTGSGKSTALPAALFRLLRAPTEPAGRQWRGRGVVCTQPRVLTAVELARGVGTGEPPYADLRQGVTVGYQTGPLKERPPAGLVYATIGVLVAQLRAEGDDGLLRRHQFIVFDEAHERSHESDVALLLLRDFYRRNEGDPRLPFLLLASATFKPRRYAAYFGVPAANVVVVEGWAFPREVHWPRVGANDYVAAAAAQVLEIHRRGAADPPGRGDVIVFLPGEAEAAAARAALAAALRDLPAEAAPYLLLTLNREAVVRGSADYRLLAAAPAALPLVAAGGGAPRRPARRVILATIVAETGITIPTVRYVVDSGWVRAREVYPPLDAVGLTTRPAAQSRVMQRFGRAGRLFPGDVYPLYTRGTYEALDAQQLPALVTEGVGPVLLALVEAQCAQKRWAGEPPAFRVEDIATLDPPPPLALWTALDTAAACGYLALDADLGPAPGGARLEGPGLTPLGAAAARFNRVGMREARVLLAGATWGAALSDLAGLVAAFEHPLSKLLLPPGAPPPPGAAGQPRDAAALRAALPPYLRGGARGGGAGDGAGAAAAPPADDELLYYRARLLLADDFAEALLVLDAFRAQAAAARGDLAALTAWCAAAGLSYEAVLAALARRAEVLDEALAAGLDPYAGDARRLAAAPPEAFAATLIALKRCLLDGLRDRLLEYDPAANAYRARAGDAVAVPPLLRDAAFDRLAALGGGAPPPKPRWLVTSEVRLAAARPPRGGGRAPLLYALQAGPVAVLDGYVEVDPGFLGGRVGAPPPFGGV